MATHEELTGVYAATRWQSEAGDYVIGLLEDGSCVKGPAEAGELLPNLPYKFYGRWKAGHNGYGPSFNFVCAVKEIPHSRNAVVEYLIRAFKGKNIGIGHAKAHALYDAYQADAVRQLRMHPADVAEKLGHDLEKCRAAAAILETDRRFEDAKIELTDLFAGKGFPRSTIKECVDRWGAKAPAMIKRDAFLLMTNAIKGAGFLRCDNLYLASGGNAAKLKRQMLAAWYGLQNHSSGDTWHPIDRATMAIRDKVDAVNTQPVRAIRLGLRSGWLTIDRDHGEKLLAVAEKAQSESDIARLVGRMLAGSPTWPAVDHAALSNHQREKLSAAMVGRIAILAGTPGTGKTYTAAALIRAIVSQYGPGSVAICAPTGKAAVRITETMQRYRLDLQACTIHRLLMPNDLGYGTGNWNFSANEENPLDCDFVIADEASMIDTDLMASLLRAIPPGGHLLLIGDPYQLPPVGHGAPLRDLIAAGVPCGELSEVKRNDGLIVQACASIKAGRAFETCQQFTKEDNLAVVPASSAAGVINELKKLYGGIRASGRRDIFEDIQVLVALNEKSDLGRTKLNPFLQQLVNPDGARAEGNRYRVGDKVICLTNSRYPDESKRPIVPVFNGEMGRVVEVSSEMIVMGFPDVGDGERELHVPVKSEWASSFDLAYAITAHKSQGSEWPVVVIVADDAADRVACREWHYTAISRASGRCIILGRQATIGRQCRRVTLRDRRTLLVEKLKEAHVDALPTVAHDATVTAG